MTYGYNADASQNMTSASIALHATELLGMLMTAFSRWGGGPIVFVAHGFGGLVVKKAIMLGQNIAAYRPVGQSSAGVVFLGTPHQCNDSEAVLNAVKYTAALVARKGTVMVEDEMREYAEAVRETNTDFARVCPRDIDLVSFFEELPTTISPPNESPYETMVCSLPCHNPNSNQGGRAKPMIDCHRIQG